MHRLADAPIDLLFGLIALHNDLIAPATAAAALRDSDGNRTVSEILVAEGAITECQRALVETLCAECIERHGGDARAGLAAFVTSGPGRERLDRVGDAELTQTLESRVTTASPATVDASRGDGVAAGDGERFRVLRPHARGGIGEVFVALDAELNREVALKRIQEHRADDPGSRARFLLEAEVTGGLEHPGIVPVYALGRDPEGRPYYAMRLIRGESLKQAIAAFHAAAGRREADPTARSLGLRQLLRRFVDVCNAVEYAHRRGVLHRDLKPSNIMAGPYGETLVVDWGLARTLAPSSAGPDPAQAERPFGILSGGSSETIPGSVLGTPGYMSPEQAAGDLDRLGPRSDVYSLGATLACLLTGRPPFSERELDDLLRAVRSGDFAPPRQVDRSIDPALEAVCLKAMALDPEDRYPSAEALADDVERWMADEPVSAWPEPIARRARRWAKRHRTAVAGTVAALVAGVIGLAAVAGVQARVGAKLMKAYDATRGALADTRTARDQTRAALEESERSLYFASFSLAEREWAGHHVVGVAQFLAQCPPRFRRWEWYYLDALRRSGQGDPAGHEGVVQALAWSPDGHTLASAGTDGVVCLREVDGHRPPLRLTGHSERVTRLAFSPDGRRLASASLDGTVRLWDPGDGRTLRVLPGRSGEYFAIAFHPSRPELAVGTRRSGRPGEAGEIKVWDVETERAPRALAGHTAGVNCVAYSPDGRLLASASEDQTIVLWDDRDGRPTRTLNLAPAGAPARTTDRAALHFRDPKTGGELSVVRNITSAKQLDFSRDGKRLAAAVADGTMRLWEVATGKEERSVAAHEGNAYGVAFSPSGEEIASAGAGRVVKVWSAATGIELRGYQGHRSSVEVIAYSPDGRWLASGDADGLVKLWCPTQAQETYRFTGLAASAFGVAFSPDGKTLAAGTADLYRLRKAGEIKLWDVAGRVELRTLRGHEGGVGRVAFSPRGDRLVSASADGTARVWDVATGAEVRVLRGHKGMVFGVDWSPDGRRIASSSAELLMPGAPGEVKFWDAETGAEIYTAHDHRAGVGCLAFSPDGRRLASGSTDKTVRVRDAATGRVVRTLAGPEQGVTVLAYSPDGTRLAVGYGTPLEPAQPSDVGIWDAESGELVRTLRAHDQQVTGVAYSPDGTRLITASRDGTVRIWDAELGQQVCALKPGSQFVDCVAFSPDGQRIASGNWNATVNLWEAPGAPAGRDPVSQTIAPH